MQYTTRQRWRRPRPKNQNVYAVIGYSLSERMKEKSQTRNIKRNRMIRTFKMEGECVRPALSITFSGLTCLPHVHTSRRKRSNSFSSCTYFIRHRTIFLRLFPFIITVRYHQLPVDIAAGINSPRNEEENCGCRIAIALNWLISILADTIIPADEQ